MLRPTLTALFVLLLGALAALGTQPVRSQPVRSQPYTLSQSSRLWLSGTSTLNAFECQAKKLRLDHGVDHVIEGSGFTMPGVSLVVPINNLDCDNRRMNKDLRAALQADAFPDIRLDVFRIEMPWDVSDDAERNGRPRLILYGTMSLAGTSQEMTIRLTSWLDDMKRLHGQGSLEVRMTDFGIDPPTALFGLVKAHDDILIRFHLTADPDTPTADSPAGTP